MEVWLFEILKHFLVILFSESYRLKSETIEFFEFAIEVCDATMDYVQV
jgi:hypothetical protein